MAVSTARARRMLEALPDYYWTNELAERMVQAVANELDRVEARAEATRRGFIPSLATDERGLLGAWETIMRLPVRPAGATVSQRQAKVAARFQTLGDASARATLAALRTAARTEAIVVFRNEPDPLVDTIEVPFEAGSYDAAQILELAEVLWPAHREVRLRFSTGFLLDVSRLDEDTL